MDPFQSLLRRIRRKQLLLCAYRPGADSGPTIEDLTTILRIETAECAGLARRLRDRGLLEMPEGEEPGRVRLTEKGIRLVERMTRESRPEPRAASPAPA